MKRLFLLLSMIVAACESIDVSGKGDMGKPEREHRVPHHLYAAAVMYPEDYDWRKDPLSLTEGVEIAFFRDSVLLESFPVDRDGPRIDADMHRIYGRHLYSDYNRDGFTCIAIDGKETFSYEGREMIRGLAVKDSNIFTLGLARDGSGWSFRRNGIGILSRSSGEPVGELYTDRGEFCFAYRLPDSQRAGMHYFFVSDGEEQALDPPLSAGLDILDIRRFDGQLNWLGESPSGGDVVWMCGEKRMDISADGVDRFTGCRFFTADSCLYAAVTACPSNISHTGIWSLEKKRILRTEYPSSSSVYSICSGENRLCFATTMDGGQAMDYVYCGGVKTRFGPHYRILSPQALCCDRDNYAIGVNENGQNGSRPIIIWGKDTLRYDFNGYFIHLALP